MMEPGPYHGQVPDKPPKPPKRDGHAAELPELTGRNFLKKKVHIVALDANIIVSLAKTLINTNHTPPLLELLQAGYLRLVMSASDTAMVHIIEGDPLSEKVPRVLRSMIRTQPHDAEQMRHIWNEQFRPFVWVLNVDGMRDTEASAKVRGIDPDDAMLTQITEFVGADYFFSADKEAFVPLSWPLVAQGNFRRNHRDDPAQSWLGIGEVTSALRNTYRTEETTSMMLTPLPATGIAVHDASISLGKKLGVHPGWVAAGIVVAIGALIWRAPSVWRPVKRGLEIYGSLLVKTQMTPEEKEYNESLLEPYKMSWDSPRTLPTHVTRLLIRSSQGMTTTEIASGTGLKVEAVREFLERYPRVYKEISRGRWSLSFNNDDGV